MTGGIKMLQFGLLADKKYRKSLIREKIMRLHQKSMPIVMRRTPVLAVTIALVLAACAAGPEANIDYDHQLSII